MTHNAIWITEPARISLLEKKKKREQLCGLGGRVNPTKDAERLGNRPAALIQFTSHREFPLFIQIIIWVRIMEKPSISKLINAV